MFVKELNKSLQNFPQVLNSTHPFLVINSQKRERLSHQCIAFHIFSLSLSFFLLKTAEVIPETQPISGVDVE